MIDVASGKIMCQSADDNFIPQRSWTALMKASQVGDVNTVKMLVGAGASLKIKAKVWYNYCKSGGIFVGRMVVCGVDSRATPLPYSMHNNIKYWGGKAGTKIEALRGGGGICVDHPVNETLSLIAYQL